MKNGYKVKICGTTNLEDARLAADEGANFFGAVVETDFSPRSLSLDQAKPLFSAQPIPGVALIFNMAEKRAAQLIQELNPFAVQFLGETDTLFIRRLKKAFPSTELWQSVHLPEAGKHVDFAHFKKAVEDYIEAGVNALIFDTAAVFQGKMKFGGTGLMCDWNIVKKLMDAVRSPVPVWLAGGISPENVGPAIDATDPYGIDLCSGVEAIPGKKDPLKISSLISIIREKSANRRKLT
ncbi:phosphoribosylanthranilate isomerase [Desulfonema magnum]|uniref:N-(5'-phosphoribosyl)anthranilate isomerase n=1 Tax=Desulfonema magnum TaxID=45655 RepID=A0A975BFP8_9BACT|nr:phosphoribosylanthranilate isomerase [Desulfonema magnum]QTA84586.1 N-(5'-phosphoribosyl)anthranilate isomerase [Desulfonema magnum]